MNLRKLRFTFVAFGVGALLALSGKVSAAQISSDYKLDADSEEAIVVDANSTVTIDLNGKTLNVTGDAITVNEGAKVVITGNGAVNATKAAVVNKSGDVTIQNGSFNSSNWYTLKNLGKMVINGGTITQGTNNKSNASLVANGWYNGLKQTSVTGGDRGVVPPASDATEAAAILEINGGEFTHYTTTSTIKSDDWSKTVINGGKFTSQNGTLIQATGDVTVTDGNFKGYENLALFYGDLSVAYEPASLKITDGNFDAKYIIWTYTTGKLDISGGEFVNLEAVTDPADSTEYEKNITGGTYNIDVKDEVAEGYTTYTNDTAFDVAKKGDVTVSNAKVNVKKGEEVALGVTIESSLEKYATYKSNNEKVATISDGKIKGVAAGSTTIEITLGDVKKSIDVLCYEIVEKNDEKVEDTAATSVVADLVESVVTGNASESLTEEQVQKINDAIAAGKTIEVDVASAEVKKEAIKEDSAKVESALVEGAKVAQYLNIDLVLVDNDGNEITKLTNLGKEISLTVSVPKDVEDVAEGYTRTYKIVRVHDGVAEELDTVLNKDNTLTFKTGLFSTYAITYIDTKNASGDTTDPDTKTIEENTDDSSTADADTDDSSSDKDKNTDSTKKTNPSTGDNILKYVSIAALALVVTLMMAVKSKKNKVKKQTM